MADQQSESTKHFASCDMLDRPLHRGGRARSLGRRMGEGPRPPSESAPAMRRPGTGKSGSQVRVRSGVKIRAAHPALFVDLAKFEVEQPKAEDKAAVLDTATSFVQALIADAVYEQEVENDEHEVEIEYDNGAETEYEDEDEAETMSPTLSEDDARIEGLRHRTCQAFIFGAQSGELFNILSGLKSRYQVQEDPGTSTAEGSEEEEEDTPEAPSDEDLDGLKRDVFQTLLEGVLSGQFENAMTFVRQEKESETPETLRLQMMQVFTEASTDGSLERALAGIAASRADSREEEEDEEPSAEDYDDVVSLGTCDDEEDAELEALGYVQLALGYAKRAVARGVACSAELDDEEDADEDDSMTVMLDETSEIEEFEERAHLRQILLDTLCDPVEREQDAPKSFRRLPSVGTWCCIHVMPESAPLASMEVAQPLVAPAFVPADEISEQTESKEEAAPPDMSGDEALFEEALAEFASLPAAAPVEAPAPAVQTPPARRLTRQRPTSDLQASAPALVGTAEPPSPTSLTSPKPTSRQGRRIFGAVARSTMQEATPAAAPVARLEAAAAGFGPASPKSVSAFRTMQHSPSSPAGALRPHLKESLKAFRMDAGDSEEEAPPKPTKASPLGKLHRKHSSIAGDYDVLDAQVFRMDADTDSDAGSAPIRKQALGPLRVGTASGRRSSLGNAGSAMAMDLGFVTSLSGSPQSSSKTDLRRAQTPSRAAAELLLRQPTRFGAGLSTSKSAGALPPMFANRRAPMNNQWTVVGGVGGGGAADWNRRAPMF